jgi:hypothetical protein
VGHTHINKGKSSQFRYDLIWKLYQYGSWYSIIHYRHYRYTQPHHHWFNHLGGSNVNQHINSL